MAKGNSKKQEPAVSDQPAGEEEEARPSLIDVSDRMGLGDWPAWFGRRLPDRWFGDVGKLFDHIRVEEYVEDDTLIVRAEIPGVDPDEDIDISVDNRRLSIAARRTSRTERDDDGYRSEFRYGSFSRELTLPDRAEADGVEASYVDGILEVRVPMSAAAEQPVRKVAISHS